jgi:hypothetical protein
MKKIIYFFASLMLFISSCTKDKEVTETSKKDIAGVYTITGLSAKVGTASVDVYDELNECQQNNTWDFEDDGTFLFGGVATSTCQDGDFEGTWSLNGKTFTITTQQNSTAYQMDRFDGKTLVLTTPGTLNGNTATYYITYTRK